SDPAASLALPSTRSSRTLSSCTRLTVIESRGRCRRGEGRMLIRSIRARLAALAGLLHMVAVAGQRVDDRDLLDREVGDDLDRILVHDQHLLNTHTVAEALSVLRLQRESHALLDLDGMIERPNAR